MNNRFEYTPIDLNSAAYQLTLKLREAILRTPLGLTLSKEDTADDHQHIHIGAFNQDQLIGCVIIAPLQNEHGTFRIRQMAINETFQGQGIGRALVLNAEKIVKQQSGKRIVLDARVSAQGFYEALRYTVISEPFIHKTIAHIIMEKQFV